MITEIRVQYWVGKSNLDICDNDSVTLGWNETQELSFSK